MVVMVSSIRRSKARLLLVQVGGHMGFGTPERTIKCHLVILYLGCSVANGNPSYQIDELWYAVDCRYYVTSERCG